MIKARSRDFVLIICGVLLIGTALVAMMISVVNTVEKISREEKVKEVLSNVEVKSTKLELIGNGNFLDRGPTIDGNIFRDYKVRLLNNGDRVTHTLKVCNNNEEDVLIYGLSIGQMSCGDKKGNIRSCDGVVGNYYLMDGNTVIEEQYILKAKACINVVLDTSYCNLENAHEITIKVDQFSLDLDVIEK